MTTTTSNTNGAVAIRSDTNEVVVRCPLTGDAFAATDVQGLINSIERAALSDATRLVNELGDIGEAPVAAVKKLLKELEARDEKLKDFDKQLKDALIDMSGFKAAVVQVKGPGTRIDPLSVRGKLAAIIKPLKEREDAAKMPEPVHSYALQVDVTDGGLKKIVAEIEKQAKQYRWGIVEGNDASSRADAFFKSIGWNAQ